VQAPDICPDFFPDCGMSSADPTSAINPQMCWHLALMFVPIPLRGTNRRQMRATGGRAKHAWSLRLRISPPGSRFAQAR